MTRYWKVRALILLAAAFSWPVHAAEDPPRYCARVGNDDLPRPAPASLATPIRRLFGIRGRYALETSYYRCADGHVLLCAVGANLSCGKADTRSALPGTSEFCQTNPNSDVIPLAVTGHDTAYVWRCAGSVAKAGEKVGPIDARGFFADNWKVLK